MSQTDGVPGCRLLQKFPMPESLQCVAVGLAKAMGPENSRPTYKL